jgi:hypothetical protein
MTTPIPFLIPTQEPDVYEMEVDNSSKELFETCARAADYYTRQRRTLRADRPSLNFGHIIHAALVPRKLNEENWQEKQEKIIIDYYNSYSPPINEWRTADRALDAIREYNKSYPITEEPFKVIANTVELPFRIKLGEADLGAMVTTHAGTFYVKRVVIFWTGKIDGIVDYGVNLILDHKTTSIIGSQFYDDFVLSSQMHGYTWAGRHLGYPVEGLLLDVLALRKPSRTGTPTEFQRQRYFYTEQHLAEWEKDTFTLITDFLEHLCRDYFPKSPKWCFGKYGRCQYWDVCTQIPEQRNAMLLSDLYQPVTWSPLN